MNKISIASILLYGIVITINIHSMDVTTPSIPSLKETTFKASLDSLSTIPLDQAGEAIFQKELQLFPSISVKQINTQPYQDILNPVLKGHTGAIYSVAFSPDGTYVLTGSLDNTARVWNFRSKTLAQEAVLDRLYRYYIEANAQKPQLYFTLSPWVISDFVRQYYNYNSKQSKFTALIQSPFYRKIIDTFTPPEQKTILKFFTGKESY